MAVAAASHGAPAPPPGAGSIVEKKAASGIGAQTNWSARALHNNFGGRAGYGCKEPVQAAFASDELHSPFAKIAYEFVVTFGDAQDFIDGLRPLRGNFFFGYARGKYGAQRFTEAQHLEEHAIHSRSFSKGKGEKLRASFGGDNPSGVQKMNKFGPRKITPSGRGVRKIDGEFS